MGGLGTRGNRDLDGGSVGHMKRIFSRARHVLGSILCLLAAPALAEVTGRETVIDGDTLEIRGQRIRLHGIDVPETGRTRLRDGAPWGLRPGRRRACARAEAREGGSSARSARPAAAGSSRPDARPLDWTLAPSR